MYSVYLTPAGNWNWKGKSVTPLLFVSILLSFFAILDLPPVIQSHVSALPNLLLRMLDDAAHLLVSQSSTYGHSSTERTRKHTDSEHKPLVSIQQKILIQQTSFSSFLTQGRMQCFRKSVLSTSVYVVTDP